MLTRNLWHQFALQRQNTEISKQIFPEKEYRGLSPNFHIQKSVSDLYITMIGLPILLEEICRPILGLYKSLTDTWMWILGLRPCNSQKNINKWDFACSAVCGHPLKISLPSVLRATACYQPGQATWRARPNVYVHCKKRSGVFPSPVGLSLTKLSLAGKNLIIPGQGVFGKWHPGWGRENR